jgi:hypothetical protein
MSAVVASLVSDGVVRLPLIRFFQELFVHAHFLHADEFFRKSTIRIPRWFSDQFTALQAAGTLYLKWCHGYSFRVG